MLATHGAQGDKHRAPLGTAWGLSITVTLSPELGRKWFSSVPQCKEGASRRPLSLSSGF